MPPLVKKELGKCRVFGLSALRELLSPPHSRLVGLSTGLKSTSGGWQELCLVRDRWPSELSRRLDLAPTSAASNVIMIDRRGRSRWRKGATGRLDTLIVDVR